MKKYFFIFLFLFCNVYGAEEEPGSVVFHKFDVLADAFGSPDDNPLFNPGFNLLEETMQGEPKDNTINFDTLSNPTPSSARSLLPTVVLPSTVAMLPFLMASPTTSPKSNIPSQSITVAKKKRASKKRTTYARCPFDSCQENCKNGNTLHDHLKKKHKDEIPPTKTMICEQCSYACSIKNTWNCHQKKHHGSISTTKT